MISIPIKNEHPDLAVIDTKRSGGCCTNMREFAKQSLGVLSTIRRFDFSLYHKSEVRKRQPSRDARKGESGY